MDTFNILKGLTGVKSLDAEILNLLSDRDLTNMCKSNRYHREFCNSIENDSILWMNRVLTKFPHVSIHIHRKDKKNRSWKQYYTEDLSRFNKSKLDANFILVYSAQQGKLASVMIASENWLNLFWGCVAFKSACNEGYLDVVKYLTSKGINVSFDNNYAIRSASYDGYLEMVEFLTSKGADVNADNGGALKWSSKNGHLEVVKFLVRNGANVAKNVEAITLASEKGHLEIVKFLVENGANIHAKNNYAIRIAKKYGHTEVIKFLESKQERK